jgi:hypothetical protein
VTIGMINAQELVSPKREVTAIGHMVKRFDIADCNALLKLLSLWFYAIGHMT